MQVLIKVKTKAGRDLVEKTGEGSYLVFTKEPPQKGKANQAIIQLLAKHFKKPQASLKIIKGLKSKQKIIKISE